MITIIGILIALLLPAVQAAREAARQMQCQNNLKQMTIAALTHEQAQGFLPTGGWGYPWVGDPDRGFGKKQPGGWHFSILPYSDLQAVFSLGLGDNVSGRYKTARTPLALFHCPTRRSAIAYRYIKNGQDFRNMGTPAIMGRSDYAGCSGDGPGGSDTGNWTGPGSLSEGDAMTELGWQGNRGSGCEGVVSGVIFRHSAFQIARISDGTSHTYLMGEKYLSPDNYTTGDWEADDQGWDIGYDTDVIRWTDNDDNHRPRRDQPGAFYKDNFGSAHHNGFFMAFCDGSVHLMRFEIDGETHRRLGNRDDGQLIDGEAF